jgi:hypothetical protein
VEIGMRLKLQLLAPSQSRDTNHDRGRCGDDEISGRKNRTRRSPAVALPSRLSMGAN